MTPEELQRIVDNELRELRNEIDTIDDQIVNLLNKRAEIVIDVGKSKSKIGIGPLDEDRENKIIERLGAQCEGLLSDKNVKNIYQAILQEMRKIETNHQ